MKDEAEQSIPSRGSHGDVAVWMTPDARYFASPGRTAEEWAAAGVELVPLYRHPQPTLTAKERELLSKLGANTREYDKYSSGRPWFVTVEDAATIRVLLERLK